MRTYRRRPRQGVLTMILVLFAVLGALAWQPTVAAPATPNLSVRISSLSPTELKPGATITMSGTVTNNNAFTWTNAQAYLVISHAPYTSRSQLDDAISNSTVYTGQRVVDLKSIAKMGNIRAGETMPFTIKVPYGQLRVSGADGVYPVGVQILGTDPDGNRSNDAIAKATTFLPMLSKKPATEIAASIVWPFLMPIHKGADRTYVDPQKLLRSVSFGGQLRNLLDLAGSTKSGNETIIIDPALLVGVDDLAHRRDVAKDVHITNEQAGSAARFLSDLLMLARNGSCWILGYDHPDVLALEQNRDISTSLDGAVDKATSSVLASYGLTGRRVSWPTAHGVTAGLLQYLRGPGDQPVIVDSTDLKGWSRRDGSLMQYQSGSGAVPVLVNDAIAGGVPGQDSVVSLRQRIVSDSALAVLSRSIDPGTKADAVEIVPPKWNPGPDWAEGDIDGAFHVPWVRGTSLDTLMTTSTLAAFKGTLPATASVAPVSSAQIAAAAEIQNQSQLLHAIQTKDARATDELDRDTADAVSLRWRKNRAAGLSISRAAAARAQGELKKVSLEGPQSVTLSGSNGKFPLTIENGTSRAITVGIRLSASNPALTIPDVSSTTIAAGERHTLNVNVDVRDQSSTQVAAQLTTPEGRTFGKPVDFIVRSSAVGTILWVAIGAAFLFVIIALGRRFHRRRKAAAPTGMTSA